MILSPVVCYMYMHSQYIIQLLTVYCQLTHDLQRSIFILLLLLQ